MWETFSDYQAKLSQVDVGKVSYEATLVLGTLFARALVGEWMKESILPIVRKGVNHVFHPMNPETILQSLGRKGFKTSEFWAFAITAGIAIFSTLAESLGSIQIDERVTAGAVGAAIMYGFSRSLTKIVGAVISYFVLRQTTAAPAVVATPETESHTEPAYFEQQPVLAPFAPQQ